MAHHVLKRALLVLVATVAPALGCQVASGLTEFEVVPGHEATATGTGTGTGTVTSSTPASSSASSGGGGGQGGAGGQGGLGDGGAGGGDCGNGTVDEGEECDVDSDACRDCVVACDQGVKDPLTLGCYVPLSSAVKMTQEEAQELCRTLGDTFDLVGIGSPEESEFLLGTSLILQEAWTGATDPELDGDFVDAQGEPFDCPWAPNNPSGSVGCIFLDADGCHDIVCSGGVRDVQLALCERLPPEP